MNFDLKKGFAFIIDTNEYAGDFEREMCAHITGHVGECEVGEEYVDPKIELLFEPYIAYANDDYGYSRPCQCYGNSVVIYFENKPTDDLISLIKERANTFNDARKKGNMGEFYQDSDIQILGFKLIEVNSSYNEIEI